MKKLFLSGLLILFTVTCFSQDRILLKRGWISVVILDVTPSTVKYYVFNDPAKRIYTESRENISDILYENGEKETKPPKETVPVKETVPAREILPEREAAPEKEITDNNIAENQIIKQTDILQNAASCEMIVYLKNGYILRGSIVEIVPEKFLSVQTGDGNTRRYSMTEIKKITKEEAFQEEDAHPDEVHSAVSQSTSSRRAPGYKGFLDLRYGQSEWDSGLDIEGGIFSLSTSQGIQIGSHFFIGGGIGFDYYSKYEQFIFPLFLDLRLKFFKESGPFINLKAGTAYFNTNQNFDFYVCPQIGISFSLASHFALNIGAGYQIQMANVVYKDNSSKRQNISGLCVNLGFGW
jgi:hypothetical protein